LSIGMAAPQHGDEVIHAGAGTGYYTAILAHLVGRDGRVYAYEIDPVLGRRATENLAQYGSVSVRIESAVDGPLPPADVIYVSAGATHVPGAWLDALTVGGRLVMPLTPNEREGLGCMLLVTRRYGAAYEARIFSPAAFIPCIGARDEEESRALAAALTSRSPDEVRSLRRGNTPDDTAWCVGKGWWLSTAQIEP
jgi:protein-L-isoaspartate(D-aspartate) O-methyltransferase